MNFFLDVGIGWEGESRERFFFSCFSPLRSLNFHRWGGGGGGGWVGGRGGGGGGA